MSNLDDVLQSARWFERFRHLVPKRDSEVLLSPPRLVARFARFAWSRMWGLAVREPANELELRDPELIGLFFQFFRTIGARYFRLRIEGIEHMPASGPVLLVGNHNGGLVPTDAIFTSLAIHDRFGPDRTVYALAHDFLFDDPLLRHYALRLGALRAGHASAMRALDAGHSVLVYPGSDYDAFRPFRQRGKVVLGHRTGFIKLALRARVPIVPVVSVGTHEQFIVLSRGDRLARLLRAHAWARTEVLPLVAAVPWGITFGFVPYLPLPAQTTVRFGAPISFADMDPSDSNRPDVVEQCYQEVEGQMQAMLDQLSKGRRFLVGAPKRKDE
jgi:1-acyl-sn-glycerol-3-phosphate acyltransferase